MGYNESISRLVIGVPTDGTSVRDVASFKVRLSISPNVQTSSHSQALLPAVNPQHCTATSPLLRKRCHQGSGGSAVPSPAPPGEATAPTQALNKQPFPSAHLGDSGRPFPGDSEGQYRE